MRGGGGQSKRAKMVGRSTGGGGSIACTSARIASRLQVRCEGSINFDRRTSSGDLRTAFSSASAENRDIRGETGLCVYTALPSQVLRGK